MRRGLPCAIDASYGSVGCITFSERIKDDGGRGGTPGPYSCTGARRPCTALQLYTTVIRLEPYNRVYTTGERVATGRLHNHIPLELTLTLSIRLSFRTALPTVQLY